MDTVSPVDELPMDIDDVSVSWLGDRLEEAGECVPGSLASVTPTRIAKGESLFGRLHRLKLGYVGPGPYGPRSLICKQPTRGKFNAMAIEGGYYERECRFYMELAATCPLPSPRAHVAEYRGEDRAILLLEDLAGLTAHRQLDGMPEPAVETALRTLAGFHAHYWERTDGLDWVPLATAPLYERLRQVAAAGFERVAGACPAIWSPTRRAMFERFLRGDAPIAERLVGGPRTLIHGDCRANNLFFGERGMVAIDWQGLTRGRCAWDAAYLLSQSVSTETRRAMAEDPVAVYHRELCERGVTDYPFERCLDDVAAAILYGIAVIIMGNAAARTFRPEMTHFLSIVLGRALDTADDYRVADRLGL